MDCEHKTEIRKSGFFRIAMRFINEWNDFLHFLIYVTMCLKNNNQIILTPDLI